MHKIGMSLFAGVLTLGALACDDGVADRIDNRAKCRQICSQVDECAGSDSSFDTGECTSECAELALDDDTEVKVDDCAKCIEVENTCRENVLDCTGECAGVVTLSST